MRVRGPGPAQHTELRPGGIAPPSSRQSRVGSSARRAARGRPMVPADLGWRDDVPRVGQPAASTGSTSAAVVPDRTPGASTPPMPGPSRPRNRTGSAVAALPRGDPDRSPGQRAQPGQQGQARGLMTPRLSLGVWRPLRKYAELQKRCRQTSAHRAKSGAVAVNVAVNRAGSTATRRQIQGRCRGTQVAGRRQVTARVTLFYPGFRWG
jgi:hypothetical protein